MEHVIFSSDARAKLLHGAQLLMESVKGTLGPCGHHVILEKTYGAPVITNDGVTIAKALKLEDPYERMGAQILLESALKTNEMAGDGTTTSILLAYEVLKHGYSYTSQGGNVSAYVEGMIEAKDAVCTYLKEHSHKVDTYEGIKRVATISAKSEEIGTLVADALELVDDPHCVTCEGGQSYTSKVRSQEGMELDTTPVSPYIFPKDNRKLIVEQPLLFISNLRIESMNQIQSHLTYAMEQHRTLIILCSDIENDVLAPLLLAHMQKKCSVLVLKAPSFGTYQQDILDDVALLTNGTACFQELFDATRAEDVSSLGVCNEAIITPHSLHIFAKKHAAIDERIQTLKDTLSSYSQKYDIQHIYRRITRLEGKLAIIELGGYTPQEIEEKKMRCEDAMQAAFAAMEEGVVAGGGLSFIQAYKTVLPQLLCNHPDKQAGMACVFSAILKPFLQLIENNYEDEVEMLQLQFEKESDIGYDVQTKCWCMLEEKGVLDPLKVVMQSLHNAISVASLLIRCDVAILQDHP